MKKFIVLLAILTFSFGLFAQGVPPQAQLPNVDYTQHFQVSLGPSFCVINGMGTDWKNSLGATLSFQIPISNSFSVEANVFGNWNTIENFYGTGNDQKLSNVEVEGMIKYNFLYNKKYQVYALAGLTAYRTSYDNSNFKFDKLTYEVGAGGKFFFNNGNFVVIPEVKYLPELHTWTVKTSADIFIWKNRVAITPSIQWENLSAAYYAGNLNIKGHLDNWNAGVFMTFKF